MEVKVGRLDERVDTVAAQLRRQLRSTSESLKKLLEDLDAHATEKGDAKKE